MILDIHDLNGLLSRRQIETVAFPNEVDLETQEVIGKVTVELQLIQK